MGRSLAGAHDPSVGDYAATSPYEGGGLLTPRCANSAG
jgi:hypothetical protein